MARTVADAMQDHVVTEVQTRQTQPGTKPSATRKAPVAGRPRGVQDSVQPYVVDRHVGPPELHTLTGRITGPTLQ